MERVQGLPELFKQLVRAVCVDDKIRLGNVDFWFDTDGPWAGELSFSLPTYAWDRAAVDKELTAKLECHKCKFCGDRGKPLDRNGHCAPCVNGMARTNGD